MQPTLFHRLRASRWLAGWLLLWVLATGIGAGAHLASHMSGSTAAASTADDGGGNPSAVPHGDCAACRVAATLSFALPLVLAFALVSARGRRPRIPRPAAVPWRVDRAVRWVQASKQGPPSISR
jgi:hypothetical protein